ELLIVISFRIIGISQSIQHSIELFQGPLADVDTPCGSNQHVGFAPHVKGESLNIPNSLASLSFNLSLSLSLPPVTRVLGSVVEKVGDPEPDGIANGFYRT